MALLLGLLHLVPSHIWRVVALIFYGGAVLGAGWLLIFANPRSAVSEQREVFRKPARILMVGFLLLAAFAVVFLLAEPDGHPPVWINVLLLVMLAGAIVFIWSGNRQISKTADAYPGKHASPRGPRRLRWSR